MLTASTGGFLVHPHRATQSLNGESIHQATLSAQQPLSLQMSSHQIVTIDILMASMLHKTDVAQQNLSPKCPSLWVVRQAALMIPAGLTQGLGVVGGRLVWAGLS